MLRPVTDKEIRAIVVMRILLDSVAAKIRDEYPDEEEDAPDWPAWVGVVPARLQFGKPDADPLRNRIEPAPDHVRTYIGIDNFEPAYPDKSCGAEGRAPARDGTCSRESVAQHASFSAPRAAIGPCVCECERVRFADQSRARTTASGPAAGHKMRARLIDYLLNVNRDGNG
jgi:hypothetical protein